MNRNHSDTKVARKPNSLDIDSSAKAPGQSSESRSDLLSKECDPGGSSDQERSNDLGHQPRRVGVDVRVRRNCNEHTAQNTHHNSDWKGTMGLHQLPRI